MVSSPDDSRCTPKVNEDGRGRMEKKTSFNSIIRIITQKLSGVEKRSSSFHTRGWKGKLLYLCIYFQVVPHVKWILRIFHPSLVVMRVSC